MHSRSIIQRNQQMLGNYTESKYLLFSQGVCDLFIKKTTELFAKIMSAKKKITKFRRKKFHFEPES